MAHVHYVMDLYFSEDDSGERFRREVLRIHAESEADAVAEAERVNGWRNSSHYRVRAIKTSARSGDVVVFDSQAGADRGDGKDVPGKAAEAQGSPA